MLARTHTCVVTLLLASVWLPIIAAPSEKDELKTLANDLIEKGHAIAKIVQSNKIWSENQKQEWIDLVDKTTTYVSTQHKKAAEQKAKVSKYKEDTAKKNIEAISLIAQNLFSLTQNEKNPQVAINAIFCGITQQADKFFYQKQVQEYRDTLGILISELKASIESIRSSAIESRYQRYAAYAVLALALALDDMLNSWGNLYIRPEAKDPEKLGKI